MENIWLENLQNKLDLYCSREYTLDDLKAFLLYSSTLLTHEDAQLRRHLEEVEGKLDIIQFTSGTQQIFPDTVKIIDELKRELSMFQC